MISLNAINRSFGSKHVLKDITFDIHSGQMNGFIGGNGAGKSTTMRILLGVLSADSGEILVDGSPVTARHRASFGYMPEERGLYPKMKVIDQLVYLARLHGVGAARARARGLELLEQLDLQGDPQAPLEQLSLGNQQRVQIAAALVHDPEVLILDEPFSGLDPLAVDLTLEVLNEFAARGCPVLFSSHQLDVVERLCDQFIIIAEGRIKASGTREQILAHGQRPEWSLRMEGTTEWVRDYASVLSDDGGQVRFAAESAAAANRVLEQAVQRGTVHEFGQVQLTLHEIYKEIAQ